MRLRCLAPALLLGLAGCGLVYTHVTVPLDWNLEGATVEPTKGRSDWKTFAWGVRFDWDSAAMVKAAREAGLTEIYYADLEIFSVLGVWQEKTAIVYGSGP